MATYKRTGPDGFDYAFPSKRPLPPCPPPPPEKPACPPPPPPHHHEHCEDWAVYPFYPPYQEHCEPVPCPPIPGRPPIPVCPPPYPMPRPEKVDESSKKLAKLSQKAKVLVQMIKDFEQKNKPAILTIGNNSYQFGTENITDFDGDLGKGMYADLICGEPIEDFEEGDCTIDPETGTRVCLNKPEDLLQSELARIRKEITLVAAALNDEVQSDSPKPTAYIFGTDEHK